jgi:hypothetical protein
VRGDGLELEVASLRARIDELESAEVRRREYQRDLMRKRRDKIRRVKGGGQ